MPNENSGFNWNASDYAKNSRVQQVWARELLAKLELNGRESLLDIGCGDGKVSAEIAQILADGAVTGVDSSEEMIRLAKQNFPPAAHPNLSFQQQDARSLNFRDQFEVVFSNAALHWVVDHEPVLAGIYQALKPGGRALVQMGGKGNAAQLIDIVEQILQEPDWRGCFEGFIFPYGFYSPQEYTPWLEACGLQVRQIALIPKDMIYKNREAFAGWFRTTWLPYIERVPQAKQKRFIAHVLEKYLAAYPPNQNGEICIKMQRLEFIAAKPAISS